MASAHTGAQQESLSLFLMGSGGDGVITAGSLIARAAAHDGMSCHMTKLFGPQIRGGESAVWLQFGVKPVRAPADTTDLILVLSWRSFPIFRSRLNMTSSTIVIQDESEAKATPQEVLDGPATVVSMPFRELAQEIAGTQLSRNTVATGFLTGLLELPPDTIPDALSAKLAKRGATVVANNIRAFEVGRELADDPKYASAKFPMARGDGRPRLLMSGNDAISLGALHSDIQFFAGYPITPASEVLVNISAQLPGRGGTLIQAEDEIAAMSMVIGASFGGQRSMTATSGPGLSLKSEAIGLAAHAEIPVVIVNVQRGGPSTGMPTASEQSDLNHALTGGHGDAPRVVVAAEDVKDCFDATVKAFYIAERYQTPVIVMSDQLIGHRFEAIAPDAFDEGNAFRKVAYRKTPEPNPETPYLRYGLGDDPVSPMSHPGLAGCAYRTSGIIHQEDGNPTNNPGIHQQMSEKLQRKLDAILEEFSGVNERGPKDAPYGIITWGSSTGAALEAADRMTARGIPTSTLTIELLRPLPIDAIRAYVEARKGVAVLELNFTGQLFRLIRAEGLPLADAIALNHAGGSPFTAAEVVSRLEEVWS